MAEYNTYPIVINNCSQLTKAAFAGEEAPYIVFSSVVGHHKWIENGDKDKYVGDRAYAKFCILNQNYLIEHGIVTNWDDM